MKDCQVTTEMALRVLGKLRAMRGDVISTLGGYGIEIDSCRINQILSSGMEKFLADELVSVDPDTTNDGRTGMLDIMMPNLGKELECKLTSGSVSSSGFTFEFRADLETLQNKGATDFIYMVTNRAYTEAMVVHYTGLTTEDANPLYNGARGKITFNKVRALRKATVLLGSMTPQSDVRMAKYLEVRDRLVRESERLYNLHTACLKEYCADLQQTRDRIESLGPKAHKTRENQYEILRNKEERHNKRIEKAWSRSVRFNAKMKSRLIKLKAKCELSDSIRIGLEGF